MFWPRTVSLWSLKSGAVHSLTSRKGVKINDCVDLVFGTNIHDTIKMLEAGLFDYPRVVVIFEVPVVDLPAA